jgi:hypothetical protein
MNYEPITITEVKLHCGGGTLWQAQSKIGILPVSVTKRSKDDAEQILKEIIGRHCNIDAQKIKTLG